MTFQISNILLMLMILSSPIFYNNIHEVHVACGKLKTSAVVECETCQLIMYACAAEVERRVMALYYRLTRHQRGLLMQETWGNVLDEICTRNVIEEFLEGICVIPRWICM